MFVLTQRVSGKGFKRNTPAGGKLKQARFVFFKGDAANSFQRQRIHRSQHLRRNRSCSNLSRCRSLSHRLYRNHKPLQPNQLLSRSQYRRPTQPSDKPQQCAQRPPCRAGKH